MSFYVTEVVTLKKSLFLLRHFITAFIVTKENLLRSAKLLSEFPILFHKTFFLCPVVLFDDLSDLKWEWTRREQLI